jgi:thiol-disulfide isomerase/thioredoxin
MPRLRTLALAVALLSLPCIRSVGFVSAVEPAKPAAVTLVPADEKELAALIAKNKGKVVFVDYWATFCGPCKKAFPHTIELHKKHQAEGLVVVSVNFDLLEDQDKALAFLKKQGATFDNLISKYDGGGSDANDAFGIGPLPHLRLYDRKGKMRYKWEGKAEDLDAKVKELLKEK